MMHLSYGTLQDEERRAHWEYAVDHNVVGLDHRDVHGNWQRLSETAKKRLSKSWRHNFDLFYGMVAGDLVVAAAGTTDLLGIGEILGPSTFKRGLRSDFFQHVRKVNWRIAYRWRDRFPLSLPGFQNTIQKVDEGSQFWPITNVSLKPPDEVDLGPLVNAKDENAVLDAVADLSDEERDRFIEALDKKVGPSEGISATITKLRRNQSLSALLKAKHGYKCQLCGFTFRTKNGALYAEVAHIKPLSDGGLDISSNMVVLCANHHKVLDRANKQTVARTFRGIISRI